VRGFTTLDEHIVRTRHFVHSSSSNSRGICTKKNKSATQGRCLYNLEARRAVRRCGYSDLEVFLTALSVFKDTAELHHGLSKMSSTRNIPEWEWELYESEVKDLYLTQNMTLEKVMTRLEKKYDFHPRYNPSSHF
jgi:hypothetical protein